MVGHMDLDRTVSTFRGYVDEFVFEPIANVRCSGVVWGEEEQLPPFQSNVAEVEKVFVVVGATAVRLDGPV